MVDQGDMLLIFFLVLGGVVAMLPLTLLGKIESLDLLKCIAAFTLVITGAAAYYLLVTDAPFIEILAMNINSVVVPNRIFGASYTIILICLLQLPISIIRSIVVENRENT